MLSSREVSIWRRLFSSTNLQLDEISQHLRRALTSRSASQRVQLRRMRQVKLYSLVEKAWKSEDLRPAVSFREAQVAGDNTTNIRQMSVAQSGRHASRTASSSYGKEV